MADIFQEVDEEVRREQLKKLWDRYGIYLIAACVLVVVGVGAWRGYEWWQAKQGGGIRRGVRAGGRLAEAGKTPGRRSRLRQARHRRHRRLSRAGASARSGRTWRRPIATAAVKAYDEIAADRSAGQVIAGSGRGAGRVLLVDHAPYSEMRTRLEPLTGADRTFRHSAREMLALSAWKAGDVAAARQWTDMIVTDPQTPAGARSRAEVLSELIAASGKG